MDSRKYHSERGSSRILAFISAILFMMLAWVVTHDYDPNARDKRSLPEYVKIASSEIAQYALSLQTTLMRQRAVKLNDISQLSFENSHVEGYENPSCHYADCQIFHPDGGAGTYRIPDEDWLDETHEEQPGHGEWIFPSNVCVKDLPDMSFQPCHLDNVSNEEVVMLLPYVHDSICKGINISLGLQKGNEKLPVNEGCVYDMDNRFKGYFTDGHMIASRQGTFSNKIFGCVHVSALDCIGQPDHNVFFFVLQPQ